MSSEFQIVPRSEVPQVQRKESYGRTARLFSAILDAHGDAVKVPALNKSQGRSIVKSMKVLADKERVRIDWSRSPDWKHFYFWVVKANA